MLFRNRILKLLLIGLIVVLHAPAFSQGSSTGFAAYKLEFTPVIGKNLPYDLYGTPGTLSIIGLRSAYKVGAGAVEVGAIVQHNDPDRAYTFDANYRGEIMAQGLNAYFVAGIHYSRFILTSEERDDPNNGLTDSGNYVGITFGGGLQVPLSSSMPLKLGMRYYFKPQYWLVLEAGIGIRF